MTFELGLCVCQYANILLSKSHENLSKYEYLDHHHHYHHHHLSAVEQATISFLQAHWSLARMANHNTFSLVGQNWKGSLRKKLISVYTFFPLSIWQYTHPITWQHIRMSFKHNLKIYFFAHVKTFACPKNLAQEHIPEFLTLTFSRDFSDISQIYLFQMSPDR